MNLVSKVSGVIFGEGSSRIFLGEYTTQHINL